MDRRESRQTEGHQMVMAAGFPGIDNNSVLLFYCLVFLLFLARDNKIRTLLIPDSVEGGDCFVLAHRIPLPIGRVLCIPSLNRRRRPLLVDIVSGNEKRKQTPQAAAILIFNYYVCCSFAALLFSCRLLAPSWNSSISSAFA